MSRISLTRMSLLRERAKVRMAERGMEILRSKRDALLRELYRAADEAFEFRQKLRTFGSEATLALVRAQSLEGEASLRSLGAIGRRDVSVDISVKNVWGVRIPSIGSVPTARRSVDRGYGVSSTSAAADEAAAAHEQLLAFVLENAPREIRLRRLASEIRRTQRKVGTLEHEIVPRLARNVRRISMALEEQERADRYRIMMLEPERGRVRP